MVAGEYDDETELRREESPGLVRSQPKIAWTDESVVARQAYGLELLLNSTFPSFVEMEGYLGKLRKRYGIDYKKIELSIAGYLPFDLHVEK